MGTITRNVRDLEADERSVLERVVGHRLCESQLIVFKVINADSDQPESASIEPFPDVPEFWKIYEGLTNDEIDEIDHVIRQRASLTRHFE